MSSRPGLVYPPTRLRSVALTAAAQRQGQDLPRACLQVLGEHVGHEDPQVLEVPARAQWRRHRRPAQEQQQEVQLERSKNSTILRPAQEAELPHHRHQDHHLPEAALDDRVMDEVLLVALVLVGVLPT